MSSSRKTKAIALSAGQGLARLIGLLTMAVMARVLAKEDLAAYRQTFLAYATFAPLMGMGVGQGMYYFLPGEKERVRGRLADGIGVLALTGLAFAVFIGAGGNELLAQRFSNPQVARMLLWMIPFTIITLPSNIIQSVLVARDQVALASTFGVIRQLIIGIATVVPLVFWQTAEAPVVGNVIASVILGCAAITLMIRSVPNDSSLLPSFAGIKELLTFAVPLGLSGMFATLSLQLDKLIVSFLCTPQEFAVYSLGATEIPLIGVVTGAISAVTLADMRKAVVDGKREEAMRLFRSVAEKSSYIILPAMMFMMITADTFIQYLFSSAYVESAIPFRIYLMLLPIRTVVFGALIVALGRSHFILFRSAVGLLINGIMSVILVLMYGPWGAVIATIASVYLWAVPANLWVLSRELNVRWWQILPLHAMGKVCVALIPLAIASLVVVLLLENAHVRFATLFVCFTAYLVVYWNNRIYSYHHVMSKLSLGLGIDR